MNHQPCLSLLILGVSLFAAVTAQAGSPAPVFTPEPSTRYGLFNGLDHRSQYGLGVFPEPFLVDDSDLEENELRFDWFRTLGPDGSRSNELKAEWEKGFGPVTLEIEVPFEIDTAPGQRTLNGFANIDVGARCPLYQFVSRDKFVDSTTGVAIEAGIPVHSTFSQNTELVPKLFNDTKIGNLTLQTMVGYSMLRGGGGDEAGIDTLEYGAVLGYAIQKPCKGVEQFIPVFELSGEKQLNKDDAGHNSLVADAGFRINLSAVGRWQPRLGIVYAFPLHGAHEELHSGLYTSLVFEF